MTSLQLCVTVMVVAATMMHPTLASLLAIGLIGVLLFFVRLTAQAEGRRHSHTRDVP